MRVNAEFNELVAIDTDAMEWTASPMKGVDRRMLDRIGGEVARATSIVRYAPGSSFSEHTHSGGEEFIVLDGTFQDEHGDYPAGTYVRNPIGTHHIPRSDDGCIIFVKLWQFDEDDDAQFAIDLDTADLQALDGAEGIRRSVLSQRENEFVVLEAWEDGAVRELGVDGGAEVLVLSGEIECQGTQYARNGWIRVPSGKPTQIRATRRNTRLWIKSGHLNDVRAPAQ